MNPVEMLRQRADSYFVDARVFKADGDTAMWAAYMAVARELREVAAALADSSVSEETVRWRSGEVRGNKIRWAKGSET